MRSIKKRFVNTMQSDSGLSAYTALMRAVRGQSFKRSALNKAFELLVPKDEFNNKDKFSLINSLEKLANTPEDA
ncbi:MAG: hypothetical protein V4524_03380 [Patescibacteria group bacterium]